jgi:hypothetical protein
MQVQTLRSVPLTDVLDRLPADVDREQLLDYFSSWTDFAWGTKGPFWGTNSHTLVPWDVLMDDLADCFAELGWEQFDVNFVFPADIFTNNPHTFVDLEN